MSPAATQHRSPSGAPARQGLLVAIEGITGAGKTHLTNLAAAALSSDADRGGPLVIEEFSHRAGAPGTDLGRSLLNVLVGASGHDRFLRSGHPVTETLLLLAIKMHDYEHARPALDAGRVVIEGRSLHTVAVYQSLLTQPDDAQALQEARSLLGVAAEWRPLPDLVVVVTDDPDTAIGRAEHRDRYRCPPDERAAHHRAAMLYEQLAHDDPSRVRVLDRRRIATTAAVSQINEWVRQHRS